VDRWNLRHPQTLKINGIARIASPGDNFKVNACLLPFVNSMKFRSESPRIWKANKALAKTSLEKSFKHIGQARSLEIAVVFVGLEVSFPMPPTSMLRLLFL